jgi:hypothetical protein
MYNPSDVTVLPCLTTLVELSKAGIFKRNFSREVKIKSPIDPY